MALGFLAWVAINAVLFVASSLLAPKPEFDDATPEDPQGPRSKEGDPVPVVFGTVKLGANVTYFGNTRAVPIEEKVKTSIFSSKKVIVGYSYSAIFQSVLCHGPLDSIEDIVIDGNKSLATVQRRPETYGMIDTNGDLLGDTYGVINPGGEDQLISPTLPQLRSAQPDPDQPAQFDTTEAAKNLLGGYQKGGGVSGQIRLHWGTLNQVKSDVMYTAMNDNSRHAGIAHVVFGFGAGMVLSPFVYGERSMLPSIEFIVRRCPSNLGLTNAETNLSGGANPAEMIYEVLTNMIWGLSVPTAYINTQTFIDCAQVLAAEDFGLNLALTQSGQGANQVITEICRYIDGQVQQHPITGLIEMSLNRDDYDPATIPVLNKSNVVSCKITRPSWTSLKNEIHVTYTARRGVFFKQIPTSPIQDIAAQRNFGEVSVADIEYPAVSQADLAQSLGVRDLRRLATPLGKARLVVDRNAFDFKVGSVFSLTWEEDGIFAHVYRVVGVDYGTLADGTISVDAAEDIFALEQPMYAIAVPPEVLDPTFGTRPRVEVDIDTEETPTSGTAVLSITPGTGLPTSVEFQTQSGNRTPSAWHQSESTTRFEATVDKHSRLQSTVQWRVNGYLADGSIGILASGAVQFDIAARPSRPSVRFYPGTVQGRLSAEVLIDPDTSYIKYAVSKTGTPSLATVRAASPVFTTPGQTEVNLIDVLTLSEGEEGFIAVLAYDVNDNESEVGTITETSTVIYPTMRATPSEDGVTGTLQLRAVDPQGMLTRVAMAPVLANEVPVFTDVAPVGGVYTATVPLIEKQPSRIDYRAYAMIGGVETIVEEQSVRFAVGSVPLPPEVSYQIDADGTLTIIARGDSDTNLIHFVVRLDTAPDNGLIDAAVDVDSSFPSGTATYVYKVGGNIRKLLPGDKFYFGVRAYNTNLPVGTLGEQGSKPVIQTDQWVGPSDARATVQVGSVGVDSRSITFDGIVLGSVTSHVDVYVREYRSDPGAIVSIASIGHRAPGSPLTKNGSLICAVANPSNWLMVTFVAVDSLNRVGAGQVAGVGAVGGTVTIKVQAAAAAQPAPDAPTDLSLAAPTTDSVNLSITMPASNLPASLKIYRDGSVVATITRTAGPSVVQVYNDAGRSPGASYQYQVYGYSAAGVLSAGGSPIRTITIPTATLPTPALAAGAFSQSQGGIPVTITPGAGSPGGETWVLEHSTQNYDGGGNPVGYGAWVTAESTTSTSFLHAHGAGAIPKDCKMRVRATKTGYGDSLVSNEVIVHIPVWTGGF